MPIAFSSSLRVLAAESRHDRMLGIIIAASFLAAWVAWLFGAEVVLVEVSDRARVEALEAAVPVTSLRAGRVAEVKLGLGRRVVTGEVLLVLEAERLRLERSADVAEIAGLRGQLLASEREHTAIATAIAVYQRGGRTRTSEARASARESEIEAVLAANLAERSESLTRQGIESTEAAELSRAHLLGRQASAATHNLQVTRTTAEARERIAVLGIELARLERLQSELRGELGRREAALAVIDRTLAEHQVHAPIAGVLGHAPTLHAGAVLAENTTVAQIVPDGALQIVVLFPPSAIGRVEPGQPVRVHLDGYPWTEYGSLRGAVVSIASEAVGGAVRVECSIDRTSAPAVALEHGLTGTAEVEVERISPAALLIRSVGRGLVRGASRR